MADPVTVGVAIAKGVVTAAEVGWAATKFINTCRKAPERLTRIKSEVGLIEVALRRLQIIIIRDTEDIPFADDIRVEDVATAVVDTVTTLSELQQTMVMLRDPKDLTLLDHLKWAYHEPSIDKLIQQLRNDMLSLQLMLAILQCESQATSITLALSFRHSVAQLLEVNHDLVQRIARLEVCNLMALEKNPGSIRSARSILSDDQSVNTVVAHPGQATNQPQASSASEVDLSALGDLDIILANHRVYRRAAGRTSIVSSDDSILQSWSVFSNLSISAISTMAVIALPLSVSELQHQTATLIDVDHHKDNASNLTMTDESDLMRQVASRIRSLVKTKKQTQVKISEPIDPAHVHHMARHPITGRFVGTPPGWESSMNTSPSWTTSWDEEDFATRTDIEMHN